MNLVKNFIILLMLGLTGCTYVKSSKVFEDRDKQELSAQSIPPLRIPPGVASSAFQNFYPMPERNYPLLTKNISPEPPGLNS